MELLATRATDRRRGGAMRQGTLNGRGRRKSSARDRGCGGMRIFIKRSNGSESARPVGETGRVSLQPAAWASGPHHRWRAFWNALGRTQTRSRKEHQIGIGGRGEEVPGPLGTIALLRRRLKCSAAIAERSSSRRFSRYWSSSSVRWVLSKF
jgi:hypothetical protein